MILQWILYIVWLLSERHGIRTYLTYFSLSKNKKYTTRLSRNMSVREGRRTYRLCEWEKRYLGRSYNSRSIIDML